MTVRGRQLQHSPEFLLQPRALRSRHERRHRQDDRAGRPGLEIAPKAAGLIQLHHDEVVPAVACRLAKGGLAGHERHLVTDVDHAGNSGRAVKILQYSLQRGRLFGRPWLMAPELERANGFSSLKRAYLAAEEQRRRLYGPPS